MLTASQRDALWAWFDDVLPDAVSVIWAHEDGPRPARPLATLRVRTPDAVGHDEEGPPEDGAIVVTGDREFTTTLQAFGRLPDGTHPIDVLGTVLERLSRPTDRESLAASGLAWVDVLQADDVPEVRGTRWEARAVLDLRWRRRSVVVDEPGQIETVEIAGEVDGRESERTVTVGD